MTPTLVAIHTAPHEGDPMLPFDSAILITDGGIVGDRNLNGNPEAGVTLIEEDACRATMAGVGRAYEPGLTRRNLTITGLPLNDLIGKQFRLGEVLLLGTHLAHPCDWMEEAIGPGAKELMQMRGGIRARVLQGGTIRLGDSLALIEQSEEVPTHAG